MRSPVLSLGTIGALLAAPAPGHAQRFLDTLPASAYAKAEQFMPHRGADKIYRHRVDVRWLQDGARFWYAVETPEGTERYLVDPVRNSKQLLVDRALLAHGISAALDTVVEARRLTLADFELAKDERSVTFGLGAKRLSCDVATYRCAPAPPKDPDPRGTRRSPDKKWDAFVRDNDLYIRQVGCNTGASCETRLTTDGTPDWIYGRGGTWQAISLSRRGQPRLAMVQWSPDSKKMVVMRWDVRGVEKFHYISATAIRPELISIPQGIPSDSIIERYEFYVIDITDKSKVRVNTEGIPWARGSASEGSTPFAQWASTSDRFFFLSNNRGPTRLALMTADAKTGAVRRIVSDSTGFRYGAISEYVVGSNIWRLSRDNEIYWYSERDGGSHLYKYDSTGRFIAKLTEGPWNVMDVPHADTTRTTFFVRGTGREPGAFKYHARYYRMRADNGALTLLTPEAGDHTATFSPDSRFFVDTYSSFEQAPIVVLRSAENGRVIRELERADVSNATARGWKPRELVTLTADDGVTPIYAAIYKPTNFDSTRRYPLVDHIYPMPLGGIQSWGFGSPATQQQALAELGFIVVQIQPRGVRDASPAIRDYYRTKFQGRYAEATVTEHVHAIKQLAARFPYIDLDKVGLYGTSGGGLSTTQAMFRFPDFFKVGVAFAGNHDDRTEHTLVGESWRGMLGKDSTGRDNYEGDANYLLAKNLRGKLMLVHGDLDEGVHSAMTTRVAAELIDAGKRFDMMVLPDQGHSDGGWYGSLIVFDYFVKHLMGAEVPQYTFTGMPDPLASMRRRPVRPAADSVTTRPRP